MKPITPDAIGLFAAIGAFSVAMQPTDLNASGVTHKIAIEKMAFGPPPARVHVGDTIEWTNRDIFRHSATSSDKSFDVDVAPNETAKVVVRVAGHFQYSCKYHPGMKGELIVEK
jgi:plastocyanin